MSESVQVTFPRKGEDYHPLPRGHEGGRVQGHAVQTINASPDEVYALFARLEAIPTWQDGVVQVTPTGATTAHWMMEDLGTGTMTEFDSEVMEAVPGQRHVSRVVNGPFNGTTDTVTFAQHPNDRGTIVTWVSDFSVPGGAFAKAVAAIVSRTPEQMLIENLRHLKQMMEAHEIPSVSGQPAGKRGFKGALTQRLLGETFPVPPGTSDRAKPQDLTSHTASHVNVLQIASIAILAGVGAWIGVRRFLES